MATLSLIRHAPTASNVEERYMGQLDTPCDPAYLPAADDLAHALSTKKFTLHTCSPLLRAVETARRLFPDIPVNFNENLAERDLGEWSGQTVRDVIHSYPDAFHAGGVLNAEYTPPSGESLQNVLGRISTFIKFVEAQGPGSHIVAVTHNGIIRLIRCAFESLPLNHAFLEGEPHLVPRVYQLDDHLLKRLDNLTYAAGHHIKTRGPRF